MVISIRPVLIAIVAGLAVASANAGGRPEHGAHQHEHPATPPAYAKLHAPATIWTNREVVDRGATIYRERCATCHGERGDGKGPGAASLPLKPADLTDRKSVAEMTDSYWFWRVSEGGQVEPFRSRGSAMPAWKDVLSVDDRWAVIAYQHTFSGHRGPHTRAEHPELGRHEDGRASPRATTGSSR